MSPSAVSRHVAIPESQFGVRLFRRQETAPWLTSDSDRLFQATSLSLSVPFAMPAAPLPVAKTRKTQSLTILIAPSLGINLLEPRIALFAQTNPRWMIRIDATPDFTAFGTEAIDLNVRYGIGGWAGLGVHCVTDDLVLSMCSPAYLEELSCYSGDPLRQLETRAADRQRQGHLPPGTVASPEQAYADQFWLSSPV
ncbi:MAG: hypothetical protein V6Z86_04160 [Hyphomicrobiales bacterium]